MGKLIIGVTGPSGSGKSEVCRLLESMGAAVIDADAIGHRVVEEEAVKRELAAEFGKEIFNPDSTLNRRALAKIVFSDKEALHILNCITHPRIRREIQSLIASQTRDCVVIDAALLCEAGLSKDCSATIAVVTPRAVRLERIMARDGISYEDALMRVNSQKHDSEYAACADHVLINNCSVEERNRRVIEIYMEIREQECK